MASTVFFQNVGGNDLAQLTQTFIVNGTDTDPSTVSAVITDPTGTAVTHTYQGTAPADVTKVSTGVYQLNVPCTIVGLWSYVWVGTGNASDIQAGTFTVNPTSTINQFYTSVEELKDRLGITDTASDFQLQAAVQAAARAVEGYCGRFFYQVADTRTFVPYCADLETEILTRDGWRAYDHVHPGDEALTLNVATGMAEWQPVQAVNFFPGQHEMIRLRSISHSSVTTPGHRWPVFHEHAPTGWQWRTSATGRSDSKILAAAPVAAPVEPKWSDALVEMIAWFWTEGTIRPSGGVSICQSETVNPANVARIRSALTELLGPPGGDMSAALPRHSAGKARMRANYLSPAWHEGHERDDRGIVKFRLNQVAARQLLLPHAPGKIVRTSWLAELTRAQLELFIRISMDADGSRTYRADGTVLQEHMAQKDRARLEAFQVACLLAGQPMEIHGPRHDMWHGTVGRVPWRKPWNHREAISHIVTEGVWCPTTANGTWFARRDGTVYATGNSIYEQPLDDLVSVTQLAVDMDGDGVFEQLWTQGVDYQLAVSEWYFNTSGTGESRPYTWARVINSAGGGRFFPFIWPFAPLNRIQVIGVFGWPQVPYAVKQATMQVASEIFKLKDSPFGLMGTSEFGIVRVPKQNPYVMKLLQPYISGRRRVGL